MTGKELILYILDNNLIDATVIVDGAFVGFSDEILGTIFIDADQAAKKFDVGVAAIESWHSYGYIRGVRINGTLRIYKSEQDPRLKLL